MLSAQPNPGLSQRRDRSRVEPHCRGDPGIAKVGLPDQVDHDLAPGAILALLPSCPRDTAPAVSRVCGRSAPRCGAVMAERIRACRLAPRLRLGTGPGGSTAQRSLFTNGRPQIC
jgi:hypothetical protein